MSWLDPLFFGLSSILANGTQLARERAVNFIGGTNISVTAVDNPSQGRTDVTVGFSGQFNSWLTALDLDFTAQATQTLNTDGTYSIGGLTWTKVNSSQEVAHAQVVNGSGLVLQPSNNNTFYDTNGRAVPGIQIPLTSLITSWDPSMALRVWIYNSTDSVQVATGSNSNAMCAIDNNASALNLSYFMRRGHVLSGTDGIQLTTPNAGQGFASTPTLTLGASNRVFVMEVNPVTAGLLAGYYGAFGAGAWPTFASLTPVTGVNRLSSPTTNSWSPSQMVLFLAAGLGNPVSSSYSTTIARVRVDYRV